MMDNEKYGDVPEEVTLVKKKKTNQKTTSFPLKGHSEMLHNIESQEHFHTTEAVQKYNLKGYCCQSDNGNKFPATYLTEN